MGLKLGGLNALSGGLYSKLQRLVTGKKATHSFVILDKYYEDEMLLDAQESVTLDPLHRLNKNEPYWIFEVPLTDEQTYEVQKKLFYQFIGQSYGIWSLSWFIWRRVCELFGFTMTRAWNPFKNNVRCSQINWYALLYCSDYIPEIKDHLFAYKPENFHSGDNQDLLYLLAEKTLISLIEIHEN